MSRIVRARRCEKGFTLIELVVAVVILGFCPRLWSFAVRDTSDKGRRSRHRQPHRPYGA